MAYLVGALLAFAVGRLGTLVGLDRDRAFYPTILVVIASYYILFAVVGESTHALVIEAVVATVFLAAALVGFKHSLWLVAAALAAHGVLDAFHGRLIANRGCRYGGRRSAWHTTGWPPGTWRFSFGAPACSQRAWRPADLPGDTVFVDRAT